MLHETVVAAPRSRSAVDHLPVGTETWKFRGQYHREDGPALIYPNGAQQWFRHGEFHREDGPSYDSPSQKLWHLNGQEVGRLDAEGRSYTGPIGPLRESYERACAEYNK